MKKHVNIVSILSVVLLLVALPLINNVMYKPKTITTTISDINNDIPEQVAFNFTDMTSENADIEDLYLIAKYSAFINYLEIVGVDKYPDGTTPVNMNIKVNVISSNSYSIYVTKAGQQMVIAFEFVLDDKGNYISGNTIYNPDNSLTSDDIIVGFDNNVDFSSINP